MAMDLIGASMTTSEVRAISADIERIARDIENTMKSVNNIMGIITGQSEGGLIEQTTTAVVQLNTLCETLIACIANIAMKIGEFLRAMLTHDQEATESLKRSIESRLH